MSCVVGGSSAVSIGEEGVLRDGEENILRDAVDAGPNSRD